MQFRALVKIRECPFFNECATQSGTVCTRLQGNTKLATMSELFGNRFERAVKQMILANMNELYQMLSDPDDPHDISWYTTHLNNNTGQEIDRTLQMYIPPVRIHDGWARETMSQGEYLLVNAIMENLPNDNRNFWIYSYGEIPYREPTSLRDYYDGHSSYNELFDAVVESIKLIKPDYRGYARHSGINVIEIAKILHDLQIALKRANDKGEFNFVDPIEDYNYDYTSVIGPPH